MGNCRKIMASVMLLLCSFTVLGQKDVDSLLGKTFPELFNYFNNAKTSEELNLVADVLIKKSKKINNTNYLIESYLTKALINNDSTLIIYCDSIIRLTESNVNEVYPREAYQIKADYFFNKKDYSSALDNYLKVSHYANEQKNEKYILKSKYDIGTLKRRINEKEDALSLYMEGLKYVEKNPKQVDTITYLNTITAIANIYNDMQEADSSSYYNKLGYRVATKFNKESYVKHFSLNQGVSLYYNGLYREAIDSLEKFIPYYENLNRKSNLSLAYYYCGKSYGSLSNQLKAIEYYKKVDTIFQLKKSIYPNAKNAYIELIKYYKANKDLPNQLLYINQLVRVDSVLHEEEIYLSKGIFKEYDIPQLESEKKSILKQMNKNDSLFKKILFAGLLLLLISLVIIVNQHFRKINYKRKFDEILNSIEKDNEMVVEPKEQIIEETTNKSSKKNLWIFPKT